jgi:hypothetical protein
MACKYPLVNARKDHHLGDVAIMQRMETKCFNPGRPGNGENVYVSAFGMRGAKRMCCSSLEAADRKTRLVPQTLCIARLSTHFGELLAVSQVRQQLPFGH